MDSLNAWCQHYLGLTYFQAWVFLCVMVGTYKISKGIEDVVKALSALKVELIRQQVTLQSTERIWTAMAEKVIESIGW